MRKKKKTLEPIARCPKVPRGRWEGWKESIDAVRSKTDRDVLVERKREDTYSLKDTVFL